MRTRQSIESETTYRGLLAAVEAGEEVALSRYGYGLLVACLAPGIAAAATAPRPHRSEAGMAPGTPPMDSTDLLSPLD